MERGEEDRGCRWRKYSIADILWLEIILELSKFGVSIENIKYIREQLAEGSQSVAPSAYPILEFHTALYFKRREHVYLMVFDDFQMLIASNHEIELAIMTKTIGNHLRISMHVIIQKVFSKKDLKPILDKKIDVNEQDMHLLHELRTGKYKAINVKLKDDQIIRLE